MRTKNSLKNLAVALVLGLVVIITNFIAQSFFINILGIEYAGLNSLFTNIISMLAVAELGLGAAIVYHLYKPLHESDVSKISALMRFYKKGYFLVALSVAILGCFAIPFLPLIVGNSNLDTNISIVFGLFVLNAVSSYLLSYKRSLLYADQKNYIVNIIHLVTVVVLNALQILILLSTQNFYLYLILKITATLAENIIIHIMVNRRYALEASPQPVGKDLRDDIFRMIKGLVFHKVGTFLVLGSTSIIISTFLGIVAVGMYSNYLLIQVSITSLFSQVSTAIKASVGNLLVDIGGAKSFTIFKRLQFANQVLGILAVSVFFVASDSFIRMWIGDQFVFNLWIVAALALNIYLILIRSVFANFKEAAGIFYEDRFVPLVESIINIVASIILIQFMGIAGAFIGTALSSMALHAYSYPKFVYKGVFQRSYREYIFHFMHNLFVGFGIIVSAYLVSNLVIFNFSLAQLLSDVVIAILVPLLILWLLYRGSEEYSYFLGLIRKITKIRK